MAVGDILKTRRIDIEPFRSNAPQRSGTPQPSGPEGAETPLSFDFRVLFENAYDAILVADEWGRVLASNRRSHSFFRLKPEELAVCGLEELVPGLTPELIRSIVATASNRRFTVLQAWCQRSDGSLFPAEIVVTGSIQGGLCTLFVQIRDATVRRNAEERLLSITRALNTAAIGIGTADLSGVITYANPYLATTLEVSEPGGLVGEPLTKFLGQGQVCEALLASIQDNEVWSDEISLVIDGRVRWLQIDAAPHHDSESVLSGTVFCVRDIGDRKRAETAEYQVSRNRLMMESMSTACHLLGQPATVLLSCLEIIQARKVPDPAADAPLLSMVHEAATEMRDLLKRMHAQSVMRRETGDGGGEPESGSPDLRSPSPEPATPAVPQ